MTCEVFKIVNKIAPSFIPNTIILKCSAYSLRKDNIAVVTKSNTSKYGLVSFVHDAPRIWNSLINELRKTLNYGEFRRLIRKWDGLSCKCSICTGKRLTYLWPRQICRKGIYCILHAFILFICTRILSILVVKLQCFIWLIFLYVLFLYTCPSENSADELMLCNSHVNRR